MASDGEVGRRVCRVHRVRMRDPKRDRSLRRVRPPYRALPEPTLACSTRLPSGAVAYEIK